MDLFIIHEIDLPLLRLRQKRTTIRLSRITTPSFTLWRQCISSPAAYLYGVGAITDRGHHSSIDFLIILYFCWNAQELRPNLMASALEVFRHLISLEIQLLGNRPTCVGSFRPSRRQHATCSSLFADVLLSARKLFRVTGTLPRSRWSARGVAASGVASGPRV